MTVSSSGIRSAPTEPARSALPFVWPFRLSTTEVNPSVVSVTAGTRRVVSFGLTGDTSRSFRRCRVAWRTTPSIATVPATCCVCGRFVTKTLRTSSWDRRDVAGTKARNQVMMSMSGTMVRSLRGIRPSFGNRRTRSCGRLSLRKGEPIRLETGSRPGIIPVSPRCSSGPGRRTACRPPCTCEARSGRRRRGRASQPVESSVPPFDAKASIRLESARPLDPGGEVEGVRQLGGDRVPVREVGLQAVVDVPAVAAVGDLEHGAGTEAIAGAGLDVEEIDGRAHPDAGAERLDVGVVVALEAQGREEAGCPGVLRLDEIGLAAHRASLGGDVVRRAGEVAVQLEVAAAELDVGADDPLLEFPPARTRRQQQVEIAAQVWAARGIAAEPQAGSRRDAGRQGGRRDGTGLGGVF